MVNHFDAPLSRKELIMALIVALVVVTPFTYFLFWTSETHNVKAQLKSVEIHIGKGSQTSDLYFVLKFNDSQGNVYSADASGNYDFYKGKIGDCFLLKITNEGQIVDITYIGGE